MTDRTSEEDQSITHTELTLRKDTEKTITIGQPVPIRISSGHRLLHHDGKCSRPHGHNYEIVVTLSGTLDEEKGWLIDKGDVTSIIDEWDHRFILQEGDPLIEAFRDTGDDDALVILSEPPTTEKITQVLCRRLLNELPNNITQVDVTVQETEEFNSSYSASL